VLASLAVVAAAVLGPPAVAMAATTPAAGEAASGAALGPVTERATMVRAVTAAAVSALPTPPLCKHSPAKRSTRFAECILGTFVLEFHLVSTGAVVGHADIEYANWVFLNVKSRTWRNTVEIELKSLSGAPALDILDTRFGLRCSAGCAAKAPNPVAGAVLVKGRVIKRVFTVESPGSATVDALQEPLIDVVNILGPVIILPEILGGPIATARCDSEKFPASPPPGCVNNKFEPTFKLDGTSGVPDIIAHIAKAQATLKQAWGLKGSGPALHRTTDAALIKRNRAVACPSSRKRPQGKSCDEYPFASTEEGAANNSDFSWDWVNATQNSAAGALLGAFYAKNRVIDHDAFWVQVS
jgi:hypothetical protein